MGWTYAIQEGDDGPVKVGRSTSPLSRLSELQCGNPRPLRLVHAWPGVGHEDRLHRAHADLHVSGEWFAAAILPRLAADERLDHDSDPIAAVRAAVDASLTEAG